MVFLVKLHRPSFLLFLNCQAYGCFEETDSVSRRLCFELLFLDLRNVKEILTMIARNYLL